jgi:hypothetical protein
MDLVLLFDASKDTNRISNVWLIDLDWLKASCKSDIYESKSVDLEKKRTLRGMIDIYSETSVQLSSSNIDEGG